jgi:hypothetical protein
VTWLDLSAEQARLLNLALNRISGTWDEQLLARFLADLQTTPEIEVPGPPGLDWRCCRAFRAP